MDNKYGFLESIQNLEDWIFGGGNIPVDILQPNGQWDEFLPGNDIQMINNVDTFACTVYGTLNAIEVYMLRKFGKKVDYSQRFTAIISGTDPKKGGNSPENVCESIRKNGLVDENLLPFDNSITTVEKYYSPNPMTPYFMDLGKSWLSTYNFNHEYVNIDSDTLKEALKHSPITVSVVAWFTDSNGYFYRPLGQRENHLVCLYGYEEGKYWKIFDSNDNTHKKLAWNYQFGQAKRIYVELKSNIETISLLQKWLNSLWNSLMNILEIPSMDKNSIKNLIIEVANEQGVSPDLAVRVATCESGLNPLCVNKNKDSVKSIDRGLYQWNSYWHKEITDIMAFNPKIATNLFCQAVKNGKLSYWNSSSKCWNKDGKFTDYKI